MFESLLPMKQAGPAKVPGCVSGNTQKRAMPACCTPSTKRTSIEAPLASGAAGVTVATDSDALKPPPAVWLGGCSSVVPRTVTADAPLPHGGRSTPTEMSVEVRALRSATPGNDGAVLTSGMR